MRRRIHSLIKLIRLFRRPGYIKAMRFGVAAAVEHEAFLNRIQCAMVVDVGANRGQFSLVCRQVNPACRIVAFEPLPSAAAVFRRVFDGERLTSLIEAAIGKSDGKATMHVSRREDSSSLLPIGAGQTRVFPESGESHESEVAIAPLTSYLSPDDIVGPALLKIDVQGFERDVLEGSQTLLDCFDDIYVECSFVELYVGQALVTEIVAYLTGRGFRLSGIYNVYYDSDGQAIQADCHFTIR
jgi:FkbM family methyltransferase